MPSKRKTESISSSVDVEKMMAIAPNKSLKTHASMPSAAPASSHAKRYGATLNLNDDEHGASKKRKGANGRAVVAPMPVKAEQVAATVGPVETIRRIVKAIVPLRFTAAASQIATGLVASIIPIRYILALQRHMGFKPPSIVSTTQETVSTHSTTTADKVVNRAGIRLQSSTTAAPVTVEANEPINAPPTKSVAESSTDDVPLQVAKRGGRLQEVAPALQEYHRFENNDRSKKQVSPFLYKGVYTDPKSKRAVDVIIKVYREGDERTHRDEIKEEIEFFRTANAEHVPTPMLIQDGLSVTDIEHDDGETYHVIVTEQIHSSKDVRPDDIPTYAESVVHAVDKLHSIGILHCDIKPDNVLWDDAAKKVYLIDFGLSQKIGMRWSYDGTKEYQAPEITNKKPHTVSSDAYGVGKTIKEAIDKASNKAKKDDTSIVLLGQVNEVVDKLLKDKARERLKLSKAMILLRALSLGGAGLDAVGQENVAAQVISPKSKIARKRKAPTPKKTAKSNVVRGAKGSSVTASVVTMGAASSLPASKGKGAPRCHSQTQLVRELRRSPRANVTKA